MNTASLELCRELFELSNWGQNLKEDSLNIWGIADDKSAVITQMKPNETISIPTELIPAYDLGYLLRKLPKHYKIKEAWKKYNHYYLILMSGHSTGGFIAGYMHGTLNRIKVKRWLYSATADTPEDCVAKLAIELFKSGVMTRE